jgi:hypothetical protein
VNHRPRNNLLTYHASIAGATHSVVRLIVRRRGWDTPNTIANNPP